MAYLIDFDDPGTFPEELRQWDDDLTRQIRHAMNTKDAQEQKRILLNLNLQHTSTVSNFVENHPNDEIIVYHCTRILNPDEYWRNGIITGEGVDSVAEQRIKSLLLEIGSQPAEIRDILLHMDYYWQRDKETRTHVVNFFGGKQQVYTNDQVNVYALNLGGETLRWALRDINQDLYRQEPYKSLWIWGTPSIIKFKCKLCNIDQLDSPKLIAEIVKYHIMSSFGKMSYSINFTGKTKGPVPPEDIMNIEKIENFIEMQERYPEYQEFYDELK